MKENQKLMEPKMKQKSIILSLEVAANQIIKNKIVFRLLLSNNPVIFVLEKENESRSMMKWTFNVNLLELFRILILYLIHRKIVFPFQNHQKLVILELHHGSFKTLFFQKSRILKENKCYS